MDVTGRDCGGGMTTVKRWVGGEVEVPCQKNGEVGRLREGSDGVVEKVKSSSGAGGPVRVY